jgi:NADH-quinone oxidoreductase subunit G
LGHGTNLGELGKGTAILVIACDLHEEAPLWWLRIRQAAKRGATLIVANPRPTRLDKFAAHTVRYAYGEELQTANTFSPALMTKMDEHIRLAAEAFASAENAIILYGSEGIGLAESAGLARACAGVLVKSNHFGRRNNGLLGVWPHPNTQGAWELGFRPIVSLPDAIKNAKALWIAGADPAGDDPVLARALKSSSFLVVQDLFLTETARLADVVLPARAYTEREGTYTSGERRIQRFYAAVEPLPGTQPDYQIAAQIGERLGVSMEKIPARIFKRMAGQTPGWNGLDYARLSQHEDQWPLVSRKDLYYAGSCYENLLGLGVQPTTAAQRGEALHMVDVPPAPVLEILEGTLPVFPVTRLYDRGACILLSEILKGKLAKAVLWIHPQTAEKSGVKTGKSTRIHLNGVRLETEFALDERVPQGVVLAPRSVGLPVAGPGTILFGKR